MSQIKKKYFGIGLNDSLPDKRVAGEIYLEDELLIFKTPNDLVKFSYIGIISNRGGSGNNLIFFKHPEEPNWIIYTSDKSILRDNIIKNNENFTEINRSGNREQLLIISILVFFTFLITGLIYGFYIYKEIFTYFIASKVPISWEKKLGKTIFNSLTQGKRVYSEKEKIELLNPITEPLFIACSSSGYEFEVYVLDDTRVNAFAIPGGIIVIHTELLKKAETPEEIAGVLAHEISHITEKHGLRQIINSIGIFVLVQALFGDFTGLLAILTQNSALLLTSKFSRDYEREADASGFNYLVSSGIDPGGMLNFFKKLNEIQKESEGIESESWFEFISTHPATDERIENLESQIGNLKNKTYNPIKINLSNIKKAFQI